MLQTIFKLMQEFYPFASPKFLERLIWKGSVKKYKKDEVFIHAGQTNLDMFVIIKGVVRSYYLVDGEEITGMLKKEMGIFACYECVIKNLPTKQYFQALEDVEILTLPYSVIEEMEKENLTFAKASIQWLKEELVQTIFRIESHIILSPLERYETFVKENSDLANRTPQKHLASFLGITPESLSRIRARMVKSDKK